MSVQPLGPDDPADDPADGRAPSAGPRAVPSLVVLPTVVEPRTEPCPTTDLAVRDDVSRRIGADPHDFAGLYIRHRTSFAAHASRFLADREEVDDVVQEAFLRLFLAMPELEDELQALSYCRRTVTNLCIDRFRADARRPRLIDLDSLPLEVLAEDELDDPVIRAEDAAVVREALSLLSPLHRAALVKREIEEKPLPVIAEELAIPEESVKHLLHRARRALRRHLAQTHLAPGVALEDTSTATLVARAAVRTGGRASVVVLVLAGLALGAGTTPREVASSPLSQAWPLSVLLDREAERATTSAAPVRPLITPEPVSPVFRKPGTTPQLLLPGGAVVVAPLLVVSPTPSPTAARPQVSATPAPAPTVVTSAQPTPGDPGATPEPTAEPSAAPTGSPEPSATPSAKPSASATPTPSPTQASPTPSASAKGSAGRSGTRG